MAAFDIDSRRHPRASCVLHAEIVARGMRLPVRVLNFSEGGAFIETRAIAEPGETVTVALHLAGWIRGMVGAQFVRIDLEVLEDLLVEHNHDILYRYRCRNVSPEGSMQRRHMAALVAAAASRAPSAWAGDGDDAGSGTPLAA